MKKTIYILLFLSTFSYSQKFVPGHFITNQGLKIECQIRDVDWYRNPTSIEYKLQDEILTKKISEIIEFQINDDSKFIRSEVQIDVSTQTLNNLSRTRNPEWENKLLLLKVLIEGEASLYSYDNSIGIKYFYKKNPTAKIEQLVYKKYIGSKLNDIFYNYNYIYQLNADVNCEDNKVDIKSVTYTKGDLISHFKKYNECLNSNITFQVKSKPTKYNLYAIGGISNNNIELESPNRIIKYDNAVSLRLGIIGEIRLPFNNYKWGVFAEAHYQTFKTEGLNERKAPIYSTSPATISTINYSAIITSVGLRHYFNLNKNSQLLVEGSYSFYDIPITREIYIGQGFLDQVNIKAGGDIALGFGYMYKKIGISARYYVKDDIINRSDYWSEKKNTEISLNLFYKF